jgi:tetratricopeptide (TPR) repeat protein
MPTIPVQMANTSKLKERARAAESREQWADAVALYREYLESEDAAEDDIALWNRVGDIHLRLGQTDRAVNAYESAATAYADTGLHNNAIALCRKILRLVPGRASVYLKLGQISAASGFVADARQNFLEYAERMRRAGKPEEAFVALREFADLSPDDTDVRRLLAEQLVSHGRTGEAVEQLRILLGILIGRGDTAAAGQVREQIRAVDPAADASPILREARGAGAEDEFHVTYGADPYAARTGAPQADGPEAAPEPTVGGFDSGRFDDDAQDAPTVDIQPLDIEPTSLQPEETPEPAAGEDLPLLDLDSGEVAPGAEAADVEPAGEAFYPTGEDEEDDDEEEGEPLPLLDFSDDAEAEAAPAAPGRPAAPSLDDLRARTAANPGDRAALEALVNALSARGLEEEVPAALEANHRALAAAGRFRDAVWPITELLRLRPGDGALLQKRVEYAFRGGDRDAQVYAYLDLGRYLVETGEATKARAVFQRVAELDPSNAEARAAAAAAAAPAPAAEAAPGPVRAGKPADDEYVDLSALILDDAGSPPSTRFVVEEKEPTGDEDRDFAEMLTHFRQKVAENIEAEDSASHYDLGVAFKEMGLVDEAIAQFQVALRGGANPLATLELLGQCFFEKGQYAVGGRVLDRALRLPQVSDPELVGVLYLLGCISEATGEVDRALEHFERVVAVDIRFRDTSRRIEALRGGSSGGGL